MQLTELFTLLNGITGFTGKVTYEKWPDDQAPALPFICYLEKGSNNFGADNRVFFNRNDVDIELYTKRKDVASEMLIETALNNAGLFWNKNELWIDTEKCHETIYEIEV